MLRLFLFIISFALGIFILSSPHLHNIITHLGNFELIGGFIAGMFFVVSFTAIPSVAVLLTLSETMNPFLLAFLGGLGGMCGDYLLMRFFRSETDELIEKARTRHYQKITNVLKSKFLAWLGPLIGILIIVSPFPDEIGITLLGITKLKTKKFLALTLVLDIISVLLIIGIGNLFI